MEISSDEICDTEKQSHYKSWQLALSSCTGAIITSLLVTPLDVIKVRLQSQSKQNSFCDKNINAQTNTYSYKNVTPFDVIKTRLQAQTKPIGKGQCFLYCNGLWDHLCYCVENGIEIPTHQKNGAYTDYNINQHFKTTQAWYNRPSHFNGTWDALLKIVRNEGPKSLWSGLSPTLVMAVPATMIYFTAYDEIKYALGYKESNSHLFKQSKSNTQTPTKNGNNLEISSYNNAFQLVNNDIIDTNYHKYNSGTLQSNHIIADNISRTTNSINTNPFVDSNLYQRSIPLIAGSLARIGAVTVISPLELIRTKVQSTQIKYFDILRILRTEIGQNGLSSLWKGWMPTILRDVPFSAIYWLNYEFLKSHLISSHTSTKSHIATSFVMGTISGTIAAFITTPFDVVKTHRQIEIGTQFAQTTPLDGRKNQNNKTFQLIRTLYRTQGLSGLYTGVIPRIIKVAPACAIMISTYEYGKIFFGSRL